mmetsp:Transcript_4403/g.16609  ORF Transcript_4403/g.16609 Transcript_4403/m.16609 type:complete len:475 (-) Transcript_4403:148-1572(-)
MVLVVRDVSSSKNVQAWFVVSSELQNLFHRAHGEHTETLCNLGPCDRGVENNVVIVNSFWKFHSREGDYTAIRLRNGVRLNVGISLRAAHNHTTLESLGVTSRNHFSLSVDFKVVTTVGLNHISIGSNSNCTLGRVHSPLFGVCQSGLHLKLIVRRAEQEKVSLLVVHIIVCFSWSVVSIQCKVVRITRGTANVMSTSVSGDWLSRVLVFGCVSTRSLWFVLLSEILPFGILTIELLHFLLERVNGLLQSSILRGCRSAGSGAHLVVSLERVQLSGASLVFCGELNVLLLGFEANVSCLLNSILLRHMSLDGLDMSVDKLLELLHLLGVGGLLSLVFGNDLIGVSHVRLGLVNVLQCTDVFGTVSIDRLTLSLLLLEFLIERVQSLFDLLRRVLEFVQEILEVLDDFCFFIVTIFYLCLNGLQQLFNQGCFFVDASLFGGLSGNLALNLFQRFETVSILLRVGSQMLAYHLTHF